MSYHNDNDWELIREEMEIEAANRRFERRLRGLDSFQWLLLSLFPKHMHNKILDIESFILLFPLVALCFYIAIRLLIRH